MSNIYELFNEVDKTENIDFQLKAFGYMRRVFYEDIFEKNTWVDI